LGLAPFIVFFAADGTHHANIVPFFNSLILNKSLQLHIQNSVKITGIRHFPPGIRR